MYLQHPVRQIHQLPLVLNNLGHCGGLILLEFTDVIRDYLQINGRTLTINFFRTQTNMKTEYLCTTTHIYFIYALLACIQLLASVIQIQMLKPKS